MSKEEFKAFAVDLKRVIKHAENVLEQHGIDRDVWIMLGEDGYVHVSIEGEDWGIARYTNSEDMFMEPKYREVI